MSKCAAEKRKLSHQQYEFICPKYGKKFYLILTPYKYEHGKHRKYCSRSCANGHVVTEEHKRKVSETLRSKYNTIPSVHHRIGRRIIYNLTCCVCGKEFQSGRNRPNVAPGNVHTINQDIEKI